MGRSEAAPVPRDAGSRRCEKVGQRGTCGQRPGGEARGERMLASMTTVRAPRYGTAQPVESGNREVSCAAHPECLTTAPAREARPRQLVAILASPPLVTSGGRTLSRVALAAELLGCSAPTVANLFPEPTCDVTAISVLGADIEIWRHGRSQITSAMAGKTDVLLGWGRSEPTGPARHHHREQVAWLMATAQHERVTLWTVGGHARHPSRWQRYTSRAHPQLNFLVLQPHLW